MRSHVDMILFCSYLHIHADELDKSFVERIAKASSQELYDIWFEYRRSENKVAQLSFHETYHYYQGLTLPYLFWYSFGCMRGIFQIFRDLKGSDTNFHNWDAKVIGFNNLSVVYSVAGQTNNYQIQKSADPVDGAIKLTAIDLIEAATTLAQFQILVNHKDKSEPIAFKRWTKRNPAYLSVYDFVVSVFEDEKLVLRFLIPMVNAAFKTTQPVRAFIDLINKLLYFIKIESASFKQIIAQPEVRNWNELFEYIISTYFSFEAEPDSTANTADPPYCRLNIENWVDSSYGNIGKSSISHPFINYHALEWIKRSKSNLSYSSFMSYPGYMHGDFLEELSKDFLPAITFLRFHIDGTNDKVLSFGSLGITHKYNFPIEIPDLMAMFSTVKRATKVQYIENHRLCHHSSCPEFRHNYCNSYPIIPANYENCGFLKRLTNLIQIIN